VDDITPRLLVQIRQLVFHPLHLMFRKCLDEGLMLDDWRHGNVTPIYKKGNRGLAENYRPVSLAFDKVPHEWLLTKLISHGIDGKIASWIRGWLSNREQRVCIGGDSSRWRSVTSGVPQGSVLGPVLFLNYISDLGNGVQNSMLKFADDTKIFRKINNAEDGRILQDDLDKLVSCLRNGRCFSIPVHAR